MGDWDTDIISNKPKEPKVAEGKRIHINFTKGLSFGFDIKTYYKRKNKISRFKTRYHYGISK